MMLDTMTIPKSKMNRPQQQRRRFRGMTTPHTVWIVCGAAVLACFAATPNFVHAFPQPAMPGWSHNAMREFDDRLEVLESSTAPESLQSFYEPHLKSFSVQPGTTNVMSVTSTCFALQAMLATENPALYASTIQMDTSILQPTQLEDGRTPVTAILRALLLSEWRPEDLFQVPVLTYTVLSVDAGRHFLTSNGRHRLDERTAARIRSLLQAVLEARPRRRDGLRQKYSDYILFECARVYAAVYDGQVVTPPSEDSLLDAWQERDDAADFDVDDDDAFDTSLATTSSSVTSLAGLPANAIPDGAPAAVALALARCAETSYNTLCRELALRAAGAEFDVMRLAYSLLTYVVTTDRIAHNTAGREVVPGQGPSRGTRVKPVNRRLVQAGLAAFFEEQNEDGLWDKGQPIYRSFRKTGRNIGNAFIFSVDTVASLLEHLPAEDFRPHLTGLRKVLDWIESHHTVEIFPDYCDAETGQCTGKSIQGWSSPHLSSDDPGPQAWSTAQTVACISRMKTIVESLMHEDVLVEFKGLKLSQKGAVATSWDRLLNSDLGTCGLDRVCTLKEILNERMITPRLNGEDESVLNESYSAILFGPPGTAKTTIAQSLAERIGYDFLVIDTSEFLDDGLTSVASRIRYVFTRLQALRRCVILFDEIEEFCLDRESTGIGMESRMLTTSMLTNINNLRRAKKSIFFLATNRLRAFDAAITRPGRFDMQLFVGTPNLEARVIQFRQKLADAAVDAETKRTALEAYENFLASVWNDDAKYMNYMEGLKFAATCANVVAKGGMLTEETMTSILKSQTAVMTVRGSIREEFDASMGMTRL